MKMNYFNSILLFSLLLVSCSRNKSELNIPETGLPFSMKQRSEIEIQGTAGPIQISVDDVTGGSVMLSISEDKKIISSFLMEKGSEHSFSYNEHEYKVRCTEMINQLIGEDFVNFLLYDPKLYDPENKSANVKSDIEMLIKKVEGSDVVFIRNGEDHTPKEAAEHLKRKWESTGIEFKSVDEFIEKIGTRSTSTGKEYRIRLSSGAEVSSQEWLKSLSNHS
jgi:hypothetical protein